jgi:LPXTG-site transpeptidase (sortase) family protein
MKRIETHNKAKTKKTAVSTTLIIVSVVLLLVGIVLLLIDPIKRANRRRISSDALNEVENKIISTDPSVEPVATYVVPRRGNEVEGEGYDFIAETEETEEEEEGDYYEEYVTLNSIGILYIDSINLRYSVWDEASQVSLRYGLGHYEDSVMPGQAGNSTILGHNYRDGSMFHKLGNLGIGDEVIFIDLNGNEYYYYVVSSDIVSADDILNYALGDVTDSQRLTLITCTYEYGMTGWRRVVICEPG